MRSRSSKDVVRVTPRLQLLILVHAGGVGIRKRDLLEEVIAHAGLEQSSLCVVIYAAQRQIFDRHNNEAPLQVATDVSHHREDVRPACEVVYQMKCCRSQSGMPAHRSSGNARAGIGAAV
jgi:hypothetical protein